MRKISVARFVNDKEEISLYFTLYTKDGDYEVVE